MRMVGRIAASTAIAGLLVLSTACGPSGSSGSTTTHTTGAAATRTASNSGSLAAKNCNAGQIVGMINNVAKCLSAGEQCQHAAISQYPKYGFECVAEGGGYVLRKR